MAALLQAFSDAIGQNWIGALALAFIVYIITQFLLAYFKHRADRRAYQYERSARTGIARFQKETDHIEKLSSALLQLVAATRSMCPKPSPEFPEDTQANFSELLLNNWLDSYKLCIERIGAAAPFLNYIDLESGAYSCGVGKVCEENCNHSLESQIDSLKNRLDSHDAKSLYTRAALLIDACVIRVYNEYKEGNHGVVQNQNGVIGDKTIHIATILPFGLLREHETYLEYANDLSTRYEHFINCAYCRLRACEVGSRDGRRQRIKKWIAGFWRWLFSAVYHHFDPTCPYALERRKAPWYETVRVVAAIALPILALIWILLTFTPLNNLLGSMTISISSLTGTLFWCALVLLLVDRIRDLSNKRNTPNNAERK